MIELTKRIAPAASAGQQEKPALVTFRPATGLDPIRA
jgi:hypothetical protein